jgi:predicted DNA-binding transcriptional regulator AlpA
MEWVGYDAWNDDARTATDDLPQRITTSGTVSVWREETEIKTWKEKIKV